jgi:tRNA U34 5-carboxymethylaminomethyl modifying GTPase MnmE/TrmE
MASTEDEIETLKLDIKLKDADSRFLQEELEKKDRIMEELTEGLKEVAITHEQWAEDLCEAQLAYEAQTRECDLLRQRIEYLEEVARAHDALKARVQILESVLKRKDKQLSELTGIMYSEEDGVAEQCENETSRPSILSMESNVDISMRSWRDVEGEQ